MRKLRRKCKPSAAGHSVTSTTIIDEIAEEELLIAEINDKISHCCAYGGSIGCLKRTFSYQTERGVEHNIYDISCTVRECREEIKSKEHNRDLHDYYITELFRNSIEYVHVKADGGKEFKMCYQVRNKKVCKKTFSFVYNIYDY